MSHEACLEALRAIIGERYVVTEPHDIAPFLTDHRGRYHGAAIAVLRPGSTDEVSRVVKTCSDAGIAIVPQGGNTGLCGAATPLARQPSVVLRLDRLNRIRALSAAEETITRGGHPADIQSAAARHCFCSRLASARKAVARSAQYFDQCGRHRGPTLRQYAPAGAWPRGGAGHGTVIDTAAPAQGQCRLRSQADVSSAEGTLGVVTAAAQALPAIHARDRSHAT